MWKKEVIIEVKDYTIIWKGNKHTNKSSRRGYIPTIIVDHITEGSANSAINWFTTPTNNVSSAHFLVSRDGQIYQFVKIEDNAWANGLKAKDISISKAEIVKEKEVNPNWYSVSIEHEGIYNKTKGALTEVQLEATIWLHQYIIDYIKKKWDVKIPVDRKHILGHYEIDPIKKPNCPGEKYPFEQILNRLNSKEVFNDIKGHWAEKYIMIVAQEQIMIGFPDGEFKPDKQITRAELAKVIAILLNE
ncbi:MAG: N-acetylmuramoyl-L-alanine amidase [Vallitalea sp.]|nr:N-acetylmuramoyl-L-alanine amidase [Vallitalea sp.]